MANYTIIGGDNKEYGPVSEADVRQWIAEGRLNAESRVKAESDAEFRTLAQFPEFAGALRSQSAAATTATSSAASPGDYLNRDYELDIGECISRGWELYKENFGLIFGAFIIMFLVTIAAGGALNLVTLPFNKMALEAPIGVRLVYNFLYSILLTLVTGPLTGGVYLVYLKVIRRQQTSVGEVFAGFQRAYLQLFLGALMLALITGACMLPAQYVFQAKAGPLLAQMQHMQNDPTGMQALFPQLISAFTASLPVMLICLLPVTFFTVCLEFTLPLIIDKQLDFATAMKTSWTMVMKHWWQVFGLTLLAGLVGLLGIFGCCIGILFTIPIGMVALMFGYETIFGAQRN
jgi:uncharacterized membrane protein